MVMNTGNIQSDWVWLEGVFDCRTYMSFFCSQQRC